MAGFPTVKLNEVCRVQNGYAFDSVRFSRKSGTPLIRIRDLKTNAPSEKYDGEFDPRYLVNPGDVLVGMDGEFKPYEWAGPTALLNQRICRLVPSVDMLDKDFLRYAIEAPLQKIEGDTAFTTVKHLSSRDILDIDIPLPPVSRQKRIAEILNEQMVAVEQAHAAAETQQAELNRYVLGLLRDSLSNGECKTIRLTDCLTEINKGIGTDWATYPVLGATRGGIAPAKERVGKVPERYKLVERGTIFYNPMRILLGSIAVIDDGDKPGITSPDYVVFKPDFAVLNYRWLYYWLRSRFGEQFIKSLTRGAVRERMLFRRLSEASIEIPSIDAQSRVACRLPFVRIAREKINERMEEIAKLHLAFLRRAFSGAL
jgi:type I restriction enzyme S subunit